MFIDMLDFCMFVRLLLVFSVNITRMDKTVRMLPWKSLKIFHSAMQRRVCEEVLSGWRMWMYSRHTLLSVAGQKQTVCFRTHGHITLGIWTLHYSCCF